MENRTAEQIMAREIMTLSEISRYLKLSPKTIVRMIKAGDLPGGKLSSQWRFQKTVIDNWITARIRSAENDDLAEIVNTKTSLIPIPILISEDRIIMNIVPGTKSKVLMQLVRPLLTSSSIADPSKFLLDLLDREKMVSTALCDGVAIPHVRDQETSGIKETCIVLGICRAGVDFDALDRKKTRLFFLLCAQTTAAHLQLLSKLTLMLRQPGIIERFCSCETKQDVMPVLMDAHFNLSIQL